MFLVKNDKKCPFCYPGISKEERPQAFPNHNLVPKQMGE